MRLANVKDFRRQMTANEEHRDRVHVASTS